VKGTLTFNFLATLNWVSGLPLVVKLPTLVTKAFFTVVGAISLMVVLSRLSLFFAFDYCKESLDS
jgi:hypothetical protein